MLAGLVLGFSVVLVQVLPLVLLELFLRELSCCRVLGSLKNLMKMIEIWEGMAGIWEGMAGIWVGMAGIWVGLGWKVLRF